MPNNQIEIYRGESGEVIFNVDQNKETIWATEEQISQLFDVDRSVINRHIRNIYRDGELEEISTCAKNAQVRIEGGRKVKREIRSYNLDAIISIGYRVNSRKATKFRVWATKVLKSYIVSGVAVNEHRLNELDTGKLHELEGTLNIIKRLMAKSELSSSEANGILEVISKYGPSFKALEEYDDGFISFKNDKKDVVKELTEEECIRIIGQLKNNVGGGENFGILRNKTFMFLADANNREDGVTVSEKAANLLYSIVKERPFNDGNKRIGALLFIIFLTINNYHLSKNGETKISDRALTALVLLIAESDASEKKLIIALICKLLEDK